MTDNTNDTYIDEDADGTPALWLHASNDRPELLLSKDELRWAVKRNKPTYWGAPTWEEHVDRLWDAIAATAGEAPKEPTS
jgi:hypothetical protein